MSYWVMLFSATMETQVTWVFLTSNWWELGLIELNWSVNNLIPMYGDWTIEFRDLESNCESFGKLPFLVALSSMD